MTKKSKILIIILIITYVVHIAPFLITQKPLSILTSNNSVENNLRESNDDTTAPIITWIKPTKNNTVIKKKSYDFIVDITDDNPPTSGNVIIEISNSTVSLFKAEMNSTIENQWSFYWDNITSYPNYVAYILKVFAKDSSSNENNDWSAALHIIISYSKNPNPSFLSGILYILLVSVIFALIFVYFRKKSTYLKSIEQP